MSDTFQPMDASRLSYLEKIKALESLIFLKEKKMEASRAGLVQMVESKEKILKRANLLVLQYPVKQF